MQIVPLSIKTIKEVEVNSKKIRCYRFIKKLEQSLFPTFTLETTLKLHKQTPQNIANKGYNQC